MPVRLRSHISDRPRRIANAQRSQIVPIRPAQPRTWHYAVSIRDTRARALQSLNEPWDVGTRRELHQRLNVVVNDPQLDHSGTVTASDLG